MSAPSAYFAPLPECHLIVAGGRISARLGSEVDYDTRSLRAPVGCKGLLSYWADFLLLIQSRFQRKEAFLPQRKCLECGGELALAFSPSELASPTGQSDAARKPVPHWRCGLCGCTFNTEQ